MTHHVIKFKEACKACGGTGLYCGMAEGRGAAVVCHTCKGTGCHDRTIEYDDFEERKIKPGVRMVFAANPGIGIGEGETDDGLLFHLDDFGGMTYEEWQKNSKFPPRSEMRNFTCPAWWYQTTDYEKKPKWEECWENLGRSFSGCKHFKCKGKCWDRWDEEHHTSKNPTGSKDMSKKETKNDK